jgi:periplasmic protein TonB
MIKENRAVLAEPAEDQAGESAEQDQRQRSRMIIALALLLVALALVLIKDRDFWFPPSTSAEVESEEQDASTAAQPSQMEATPPQAATGHKAAPPFLKSKKHAAPKAPVLQAQLTPLITRAALPPLQVEVVAGDEHRTMRPGSNSVKVDLQPKTAPPLVTAPAVAEPSASNAPGPATDAAERVRLSPDTTQALVRPVNPDYPLLARQMKVQGSVLMQALISRDGVIQDLQVLSGPPILASAAQEAVKQWRFKPYYQSGEAVETQAHITVNFTISTN